MSARRLPSRCGPAVALVFGAVGLYGVLSYVVAERTREIGVRMALGARADQVRRMVVVHGIRVVAIGVVVGASAAGLMARTLQSLLFKTEVIRRRGWKRPFPRATSDATAPASRR